MASTTKIIIAEQVRYRLEGGWPDIAAAVQDEDIHKATEQLVNTKFKMQHFSETMAGGETIPDGLSIATYENVTVVSSGDRSKAVLPTKPISLPRNMGVFNIFNDTYPDFTFIPLQRGQMALLRADSLLNNLIGDIGYEVKNDHVLFTVDLTTAGVSDVTMELVVFDISQYSDTQVLPIPSDMEAIIVEELVKSFAGTQPETGAVNKFTTIENKGQ